VRLACRRIDAALADGEGTAPSLSALGAALETSPFHLQRLFKRYIGISPRDYAASRRLARVKAELKNGAPVAAALYEAGYGSTSRLYEGAGDRFGMTPATYGKGGEGARIGFVVADCPLAAGAPDRLLVAATSRGLCAVRLGSDAAALEAELRREFPKAEIGPDPEALAPAVSAVLDHLAGRAPDLSLPLDIWATGFQWRVWEALRRIPRGTTASYGEIAKALGQQHASRAVGRACAANPVALVIPCHRVVREDGDLGGYRWGVERKRRLLATEQATPADATASGRRRA
jgi:AraC family transcriptional regulator of adaptative response/methylated-DNA-[protein]-cysteine methyltransferase